MTIFTLYYGKSCEYTLLMLTHGALASHKRDIGNSVDPDQTPQNAASNQYQHCIKYRSFCNTW